MLGFGLWTLAPDCRFRAARKGSWSRRPALRTVDSDSAEAIVDAKPIPIPNIDNPNLFRYPYKVTNPNDIAVADVLRLNRAGDYQRVIKAWHHLRMMDDSVTWKQLGLGVAYLRLDKLDQALEHLTQAVKRDPTNAVAEYFLGQVRREQSRDVPFWFEMNDNVPFRLVAYNQDQSEEADRRRSGTITRKGGLAPLQKSNIRQASGTPFPSRDWIGVRNAISIGPSMSFNQPFSSLTNGRLIGRPFVIS